MIQSKGVTYFNIERYNTGWRVCKKKDGNVLEVKYCLTREDALKVRNYMSCMFWGFNPKLGICFLIG